MDPKIDPPAKPLITRHDVTFLNGIADRLHALGYDATGRTLRELAGRVGKASVALMKPEAAEARPAVVESAGYQ